jgi:hypothetical protein
MRTNRLWTSSETTDASSMGAREYPKTHWRSAQWHSNDMLAYKTLEERPGHQHMIVQSRLTYTLPPSNLELTVMTTDPMVTREMTREKTFIDCSGGDYRSALSIEKSKIAHINGQDNG